MVEFERLAETAAKLTARLSEVGLAGLDETLTASRTTSGTYRYTYDPYVRYFRDKPGNGLTEQDLFVGFAFAYSWMSSIKQLDPALATVASAVAALNKLHVLQAADLGVKGYDPAAIDPRHVEGLATMIEPIRYFLGSVIGTSKLLHFANPEVFPIWDAVIHRYCRLPEHPGAADSLKVYAHYTFMVHHLVSHPDYEAQIYGPLLQAMEQAHNAISDQYRAPEPVGKVRSAEFIMFFGGKAEHSAA
jgi:hypothetical protein